MHKLRLKFWLTGLLFVIALGLPVVLAVTATPATPAVQKEIVPTVVLLEQDGTPEYIIKIYHQHLAVFDSTQGQAPLLETAIAVEQLRSVDQYRLRGGITVGSYAEVLRLLEDYGS